MGREVEFSSEGVTTPGYLAESATRVKCGVVVIQEWWGLDEHMRDVTDRFAAAGMVALAPDLYRGRVTASPDEAARLRMAMNIDVAARDLRGAIAYLRGMTSGPVATVGFCMGGALSLFAACLSGRDVGACVVYYGGHREVRYDLTGLVAPLLAHWAETDPSVNAHVPALEAALRANGGRFEFHHYPGTRHGFFNDRRTSYHADAAPLSWRRTLAFLRATLTEEA